MSSLRLMSSSMAVSSKTNSSILEELQQLQETVRHLTQIVENTTDAHDLLTKRDNQHTVFICAILVLNMQFGYALIEIGFNRVKNVVGTLFKKSVEFCLCTIAFFAFGYSFAYGDRVCNSAFGLSHFFGTMMHENDYDRWIFHFALIAKTVSIISACALERGDIRGFSVLTLVLSGFTFPAIHHWMWNRTPVECQGWLFRLGFLDVCGSTVVHVAAGSCALVACGVVGHRKKKKRQPKLSQAPTPEPAKKGTMKGSVDQTPPPDPGPPPHNVPLIFLGVGMLFTGFQAQGIGCVFHNDFIVNSLSIGAQVNLVLINNVVAFSFSAILGVFLYRFFSDAQKFNLPLTLMTGVAGMVSVQAGASLLDPWAAALIAIPAGQLSFFIGQRVAEKDMDDPANVIGVNFGPGCWGMAAMWLVMREDGLLIHWKGVAFRRMGWNIFGTVMTTIWCLLNTGLVLWVLKTVGWVRVSEDVEKEGVDKAKHEHKAYPEFAIAGANQNTPRPPSRRSITSIAALEPPSPRQSLPPAYQPSLPDHYVNTPRPSPIIIPQDVKTIPLRHSVGSTKEEQPDDITKY